MKLLDLLTNAWAIQPEKLAEILAIYATHLRGEQIDIKGIEARLGRPLASEQQDYSVRDGGVAVLPIEGVIAPKANLFTQISGGTSAQMVQTQLESALVDARVKSIVLAIDSPGGSIFGTPELAATVREMAQTKPIVAVSDGMLASAAYWIGSAANAVFLSGPTVHAGSIGVVMAHEFNPRAQGRVTEISAGKYKRIASENEPLSDEARAYLQDRVDHVYSVFVDTVAANRGVSSAQVLEDMADGRVFVGQQAIDRGLADGFMSVDQAVEALAADPAKYANRKRATPRSMAARVAPAAKTPATAAESAPVATANATTKTGAILMDRTQIETQHPALFAELRDTFRAEGAATERDRIQAVEASCLPGHEALIASIKFDGKSTAADAALAIVAAERKLRSTNAAAIAGDAPKPVVAAATPAVDATEGALMADKTVPIEERCKAQWAASAKTRAEFGSLEEFTALTKAEERGNVRVLGKQRAA